MIEAVSILASFAFGIITGVLVQYARFRYSSRLEKMKRISSYLESAFPIVEKINHDSKYAAGIQLQDDEAHLSLLLEKVGLSLNEYSDWFAEFRERGMVPELESLNQTLSNHFVGLFMYARLSRLHGLEYISQRVRHLAGYCETCEQELKRQLSI